MNKRDALINLYVLPGFLGILIFYLNYLPLHIILLHLCSF